MTFRILHISDLHFGPHCQLSDSNHISIGLKAADGLLQNLLDNNFQDIDAVVVSGDFSWSNQKAEFEASTSFVRRLSDIIKLPISHFVIVPGNHDITWSKVDNNYENEFQNLLVHEAEGGYRDFLTSIMKQKAPDFLTVVKLFLVEKVIIVGFNSCRLHEMRNAGLGYVGKDQFERAVLDICNNSIIKNNWDDYIKIAVLHHHLLPVPPFDINFTEIHKPPHEREFSLTIDAGGILDLLIAYGFSLVLHGHMHIPFCAVEGRFTVADCDLFANKDNGNITVTAAGTLISNKLRGSSNQYQIIDLEPKSLELHSVEFNCKENQFYTKCVHNIPCNIEKRKVGLRPIPWADCFEDSHAQLVKESEILLQRVFMKDPDAVTFLFQLISPLCNRTSEMHGIGDGKTKNIFDNVLDAWFQTENPIQRYEQIKNRDSISFAEYILRLMVAAHHV